MSDQRLWILCEVDYDDMDRCISTTVIGVFDLKHVRDYIHERYEEHKPYMVQSEMGTKAFNDKYPQTGSYYSETHYLPTDQQLLHWTQTSDKIEASFGAQLRTYSYRGPKPDTFNTVFYQAKLFKLNEAQEWDVE